MQIQNWNKINEDMVGIRYKHTRRDTFVDVKRNFTTNKYRVLYNNGKYKKVINPGSNKEAALQEAINFMQYRPKG